LVATIVYVALDEIAVGVPEMAPVDVSRDKPAGSVGETDHDTTVPPVEVGVAVVIAESFARVKEFGE
jgi:hypothetical protein